MSPHHRPVEDVLRFARGWIAANIEVGPFSWKDNPIDDEPIHSFRQEATRAGLTEADLERGIGDVRVFIAKAYEDAVCAWQAAQREHHDQAKAAERD